MPPKKKYLVTMNNFKNLLIAIHKEIRKLTEITFAINFDIHSSQEFAQSPFGFS